MERTSPSSETPYLAPSAHQPPKDETAARVHSVAFRVFQGILAGLLVGAVLGLCVGAPLAGILLASGGVSSYTSALTVMAIVTGFGAVFSACFGVKEGLEMAEEERASAIR